MALTSSAFFGRWRPQHGGSLARGAGEDHGFARCPAQDERVNEDVTGLAAARASIPLHTPTPLGDSEGSRGRWVVLVRETQPLWRLPEVLGPTRGTLSVACGR
jgi:hypothetical protein